MLLIPLASALEDKHYDLELSYDYINNKVSLTHIYVIGGEIPVPESRGDYLFELRSFEDTVLTTNNFHMSANNNIVSIKSPYYKEGKTINIYDKNNKKILGIDIGYFADVCGDKRCQQHENFAVCPQDCPSGKKDNYCDKKSDGKCDPDCISGDFDCEAGLLKTIIIAVSLLILIILIIILIKLKPNLLTKKPYENILELKNYILTNLKRGYTKQQTSAELLKDGWPKKLIKKTFKSIKPAHTTKEDMLELHNYIINTEKAGYTDAQIKKELLSEGWSKESLNLAFKTTGKPKTVPKQQTLELRNYITTTLDKGYTRKQITAVLVKEGWQKSTIDCIFNTIKKK